MRVFLLLLLLLVPTVNSSGQVSARFGDDFGVDETFDFGRWPYPLYEEVAARLQDIAGRYPDLTSLSSIGKTIAGRDLWVMEITNRETGPGVTKPGVWVDGNMHAGEVNGRRLTMYLIERLLASYGNDPDVTRLIDTRTFYVLPMFDADGGERTLTRHPAWSGHDGEQQAGQDLDGDGYITSMRQRDRDGAWYESADEPRLMLRIRQRDGGRWNPVPTTYADDMYFNYREPDIGWKKVAEPLEPFDDDRVPREQRFNVWVEGARLEETVRAGREPANFNRNWSAEWEPEQRGAGPFPFSQPEVRAVAQFLTTHKNIYFYYNIHADHNQAVNYMVRPPMDHSYEYMPPEDNEFYVRLGGIWAALSDGFTMESDWASQEVKVGYYGRSGHGFGIDWNYMVNGIHALTPEFSGAGRDYDGDHYVTQYELVRWSDEEQDGLYFRHWTPYEHPLLGTVEIGGERGLPVAVDDRLRTELQNEYRLILNIAELAADLRIKDLTAEPVGDDTYRVVATVQNTGFLSTYVTRKALEVRREFPINASIEVTGGELVGGDESQNIGHILGKIAYIWRWGQGADESTKTVEWMIRSTGGPLTVRVQAVAHRAGRDQRTLTVGTER